MVRTKTPLVELFVGCPHESQQRVTAILFTYTYRHVGVPKPERYNIVGALIESKSSVDRWAGSGVRMQIITRHSVRSTVF